MWFGNDKSRAARLIGSVVSIGVMLHFEVARCATSKYALADLSLQSKSGTIDPTPPSVTAPRYRLSDGHHCLSKACRLRLACFAVLGGY